LKKEDAPGVGVEDKTVGQSEYIVDKGLARHKLHVIGNPLFGLISL
jgi:hypothetical protein